MFIPRIHPNSKILGVLKTGKSSQFGIINTFVDSMAIFEKLSLFEIIHAGTTKHVVKIAIRFLKIPR